MSRVAKKFVDRARPALRRYQKVLESARARDVNESDTVVIVGDFLTDVLGYDKYEDLTTEFSVRCTFCDIAIKRGGQVQYLIEVKSIGTDLRDNHLRQAVDYGANQGIEWVLLTNGVQWQAHRIRFEQPIAHDMVFSLDLLDPDVKAAQLLERLYLISKEAGSGGEIDRYYRQKEATSRYVIAQLLLDQPALALVRRELRRLYPDLRIKEDEIGEVIRAEVLKRDVLEGEKATAAQRLVRRAAKRRQRAKAAEQAEATPDSIAQATIAETPSVEQPSQKPASAP